MVKDCSTCKYARHYMATRWEPEDWDCVAPDSMEAAEWDGTGTCPSWEEYVEPPYVPEDEQ